MALAPLKSLTRVGQRVQLTGFLFAWTRRHSLRKLCPTAVALVRHFGLQLRGLGDTRARQASMTLTEAGTRADSPASGHSMLHQRGEISVLQQRGRGRMFIPPTAAPCHSAPTGRRLSQPPQHASTSCHAHPLRSCSSTASMLPFRSIMRGPH